MSVTNSAVVTAFLEIMCLDLRELVVARAGALVAAFLEIKKSFFPAQAAPTGELKLTVRTHLNRRIF